MNHFRHLTIPLLLGSLVCSAYILPKERRYVDYFLKLEGTELSRIYDLHLLSSSAEVGQEQIEKMNLSFTSYRTLDRSEARRLIVALIEQFFEKIQSDPTIMEKKMLSSSSELAKRDQLYLEIKMENIMSVYIEPQTIERVIFDKGKIRYHLFPASKIFYSGHQEVFQESFQDALIALGRNVPFDPSIDSENDQKIIERETGLPFDQQEKNSEVSQISRSEEDAVEKAIPEDAKDPQRAVEEEIPAPSIIPTLSTPLEDETISKAESVDEYEEKGQIEKEQVEELQSEKSAENGTEKRIVQDTHQIDQVLSNSTVDSVTVDPVIEAKPTNTTSPIIYEAEEIQSFAEKINDSDMDEAIHKIEELESQIPSQYTILPIEPEEKEPEPTFLTKIWNRIFGEPQKIVDSEEANPPISTDELKTDAVIVEEELAQVDALLNTIESEIAVQEKIAQEERIDQNDLDESLSESDSKDTLEDTSPSFMTKMRDWIFGSKQESQVPEETAEIDSIETIIVENDTPQAENETVELSRAEESAVSQSTPSFMTKIWNGLFGSKQESQVPEETAEIDSIETIIVENDTPQAENEIVEISRAEESTVSQSTPSFMTKIWNGIFGSKEETQNPDESIKIDSVETVIAENAISQAEDVVKAASEAEESVALQSTSSFMTKIWNGIFGSKQESQVPDESIKIDSVSNDAPFQEENKSARYDESSEPRIVVESHVDGGKEQK